MTQRQWQQAVGRVAAAIRDECRGMSGEECELIMALQVLQRHTGSLSRQRLDGILRAIDAHWQQQQ